MTDLATDWNSIYTASFIVFCASVQFGLYLSSLWPYLQAIDPDATEQFWGFVAAAFCLAQCIFSPIFGRWSNWIRQVKRPMTWGLVAMIAGNTVYLCTELFPYYRRYVLLLARFITGIGSANLSLIRAYASTSCHPIDRARAMTLVTGATQLGILIGPGIQLLFTPISYPGVVLYPNFSISMYTASSYCACLMNLISMVVLRWFFKETYAGVYEQEDTGLKLPRFDVIAVFICILTKFAQQIIFSNIEIVGAPYAMSIFGFTSQETVQILSGAQIGQGLIAIVIFALVLSCKLNKFLKCRPLVIISFLLLLAFHLITYPWSGLPSIPIDANTTVTCALDWCDSTPQVNPWVYYAAFVILVGFSCPLTDIGFYTIYGRVLGPRRQGTMQGILQLWSSLALTLSPLTLSYLYANYGPKFIWQGEIAIICVILTLWVVFYKKMVAQKIPEMDDVTVSTVVNLETMREEKTREKTTKF